MSPPRRVFGTTWWGKAWIDALEGRARLDPNRLPRGRTYARQDRAGPLTLAPGSVSAKVRGSRRTPYTVEIRVRTFTDDESARVVAAIAAKAAHAAALLDGEIDPGVLDDVTTAGVDLLPGPGEIGPRCSCPDWADPCKHAAAVCYLVADAVDADPFELFHLRGLPRDRLLAAVREHRRGAEPGRRSQRSSTSRSGGHPDQTGPPGTPDLAAATGRAGARPPAVAAKDAFAAPQPDAAAIWALGLPTPPARPGRPAPAAVDPPRSSELDPAALGALATDAAERAWALVRGDARSGLDLPAEHDLARRAAPLLGTSAFTDLAARAGVRTPTLVALTLAWRIGGPEGVTVASEPWTPPPGALDEGRAALAAALRVRPALVVDGTLADDAVDEDDSWDDDWDDWEEDDWDDEHDWLEEDGDDDDVVDRYPWQQRAGGRLPPPRPADPPDQADELPPPRITARRNRVGAGAVQLRLSTAGSWFRFAEVDDRWELVAGPASDPVALFADLRGR